MAGYVFKKIEIQNFKYISNHHPLSIEFNDSDIIILSGQNGYGKTTLFDALELLLSGTIKHFNADLLNRGTESIGVLAKDTEKDIVITGWLFAPDYSEVKVERRLKHEQNYSSVLSWNGNEISQEELYLMLKTSSSMLDIGTYISQSQSLNFLQNKYKSRKEQVSTLLDDPKIVQKIQLLKEIQDRLKSRLDEQSSVFALRSETLKKKADELERQVKSIEAASTVSGENIRLFPNKEYDFDLVDITADATYEKYMQPLRQIGSFIKNYSEYIKCIRNNYVDKVLEISPQIYMALFYSKQISLLKDNAALLEILSKSKLLLGQYKQRQWTLDSKIFSYLEIPLNLVEEIRLLLQLKQNEQKKLNESDQVLLQLGKTRGLLVEQFHTAVQQGTLEKQFCPLCGTKLLDINSAFTNTEKILSRVHEDGVKDINELEKKLSDIYTGRIIPSLEDALTQNYMLIRINDALGSCKALSPDDLFELLNKLGITSFSSARDDSEFDTKEFSEEYEKLRNQLQQHYQPSSIVISGEEMELYKSIHHVYYGNQTPMHTLKQIESKQLYIAKSFLNNYSSKLAETKKQQETAVDQSNEYQAKSIALQDAMKLLVRKYEESYKEYQSLLANAIRLPLMIYSGKIIQNYPLGLGIKSIVRTNQLVFEAASKNGVDAYNILSTGQLNGLAIAILLSVRNVYGHPDGLDILLIDDPLQTIDDISAISLADLLVQQNIGQIILSTHEDKKACLFKFKFEQDNLRPFEINMQNIYLSLQG